LGHTVTLRSVLGKGTRCRLEIELSDAQKDGGELSTPMPLEDVERIYHQMMPRERAQ
jgi:hypothetical protein